MPKIPGTDFYSTSRTIVKKGVLLLPEEEKKGRELRLYSQVERTSLNASKNFKYSDPKSFYGYCQAFYGGFVIDQIAIEFENQLLFRWDNNDAQEQIRDACIHTRTLQAIRAVIPDNPIWTDSLSDGESPITPRPIEFPVDFFAFVLFDKTTLIARTLTQELINECNIFVDWKKAPVRSGNRPTPFHPPEVEEVPVNEDDPDGYDLGDAPYDPVSNDAGRSYPPPEAPEPPPEPLGSGPWDVVWVVQPRSPFAPYDPQGPTYEVTQSISGGSPRVTNPRITGYFKGNPPFPWNQAAEIAYDLLNGPPQVWAQQIAGGTDELISGSFRKPAT